MTAADLIRCLQTVPPSTEVVITTTASAAHRDIPLELHHLLVHRSAYEDDGEDLYLLVKDGDFIKVPI